MALMIKLSSTCCSCTRSPWTRGKPSANCVRTKTPLFAASVRVSHDFENCAVDGDRILPRRRFLYERAGPPDDLARTITLLYDTGERLARLAEIRWLRA